MQEQLPSPPVSPLAHVLGRLQVEKAIALEQAQHPAPHEALDSGDVALAEHSGGMESQFPSGALTKDSVDDTDVEVQMRIRRRAESLNEGDRSEAHPRRGARSGRSGGPRRGGQGRVCRPRLAAQPRIVGCEWL